MLKRISEWIWSPRGQIIAAVATFGVVTVVGTYFIRRHFRKKKQDRSFQSGKLSSVDINDTQVSADWHEGDTTIPEISKDEGVLTVQSLRRIILEYRRKLKIQLEKEQPAYVKARRKYLNKDPVRYRRCIMDYIERAQAAENEILVATLQDWGVNDNDFEEAVETHYRKQEVQRLLKLVKPKPPGTTKLPSSVDASKFREILRFKLDELQSRYDESEEWGKVENLIAHTEVEDMIWNRYNLNAAQIEGGCKRFKNEVGDLQSELRDNFG